MFQQAPLLLVLLISLPLISCEIGSCQVSKLGYNECMDQVDQFVCEQFQGSFNTTNCTQRGIKVGRCCSGSCTISSYYFCTLAFGGTWNPNNFTCECDLQSCCVNHTCTDGVDKETCETMGGVHADKPCLTDWCLPELGACCGATCDDIPQKYCQYTWMPKTTCNVSCAIRNVVANITTPGATGRCCNFVYCNETTAEYCAQSNGIFTEGKACSLNDPCQPVGACLRQDFCQSPISQSFCQTYGGTFISNGICSSGSSGPMGKCVLENECWVSDQYSCEFFGATWYKNETCVEVGSCCVQGTCFDVREQVCEIAFNGSYDPNGRCINNQICVDKSESGVCCLHGFCLRESGTPTLGECKLWSLYSGSSTVDFTPKQQCQSNGICKGNSLQFSNEAFAIKNVSNINVKGIGMSVSFSTLDFAPFTAAETNVSVNNSTVKFENSSFIGSLFNLNNSNLTLLNSLSMEKTNFSSFQSMIQIYGNLTVDVDSNLGLDFHTNIVSFCAEIKGNVTLDLKGVKNLIGSKRFITTSSCNNLFLKTQVIILHDDPCVVPESQIDNNGLALLFKPSPKCEGNRKSEGTILGLAMFLFALILV